MVQPKSSRLFLKNRIYTIPLGVSPDCKSAGAPSGLALLGTPYALKGQKLLAQGNTLG